MWKSQAADRVRRGVTTAVQLANEWFPLNPPFLSLGDVNVKVYFLSIAVLNQNPQTDNQHLTSAISNSAYVGKLNSRTLKIGNSDHVMPSRKRGGGGGGVGVGGGGGGGGSEGRGESKCIKLFVHYGTGTFTITTKSCKL